MDCFSVGMGRSNRRTRGLGRLINQGAGALVGDKNAPVPLRPPASAPASVSIFLAWFKKAKVALIVGATPENIMFAGSAVKDAPHHASVPGFVYTGFPGRGHICRQTDLHMSICGSQQSTQL